MKFLGEQSKTNFETRKELHACWEREREAGDAYVGAKNSNSPVISPVTRNRNTSFWVNMNWNSIYRYRYRYR